MPRAKRAKQYRKLMAQFAMGFGFHVPYQVLVDADFLAESMKCKMEIIRRLEDTLHGQVKPLITQCSMRHLYARKSEPGVEQAIELAKAHFERRRCGHHPDEYPEPLSAYECVHAVVDPGRGGGANKHRYVCAVNDDRLRASLRRIPGVPLIFIRRSVVLMEPMAAATARARSAEERRKFRAEIKMPGGKRKREEEEDVDEDDEDGGGGDRAAERGTGAEVGGNNGAAKPEKKKQKKPGPKGPNPLSVKKKKTKPTEEAQTRPKSDRREEAAAADGNDGSIEQPKKKRKRKNKVGAANGESTASAEDGVAPVASSDA